MNDLSIQLISTDFDGTLFAEFENPPVPDRLQERLSELQASGVKWVINTGRDMSSLMETLGRGHFWVEPDFLVTVEREIHLLQDSQYVGLEEWNNACSSTHAALFAQVRVHLPEVIAWIKRRFHVHIYEDTFSPFCLIASNNGDADIIHAYLNQFCDSIPDLTVMRNDVYARFSHRAYNKGTAMAEIARRLGIPREKVFAAGDHLNDLPMLSTEHAGCIAAPANAIPLVKEHVRQQAGFVSVLPQGAGVLDALEFHLDRAK
jgi:hydroxymethylpyrimidine pyrophosphatase-like HAD family hydrolase